MRFANFLLEAAKPKADKPTNPVVKAMIEQPNRSLKKHKSSRWKLFQEILQKEIKERETNQR
jgi:hypothetical protein